MASVQFRNCRKTFPPRSGSDAVNVLKGVNLTVKDGEFLVLVGPSGCGKTTLLRLLAGLEHLSAGDVLVDGQSVQGKPAAERNVAMVFQNYALYPHLSVAENLAFGLRRSRRRNVRQQVHDWLSRCTSHWPGPLRLRSRREAAVANRVKQVAAMLDLGSFLDRRPKELSGGQKQRVALGRAIAREPAVFLMDEPLSNLDAQLRTETRAAIARLQRELGVTTLYVTHDQVEAMTMGDRIAVLHDGVLQQLGTPPDLYEHPANLFVAQFIGSPAMNLLPVTARAGGLQLNGRPLTLSRRLQMTVANSGATVATVGIRAEGIRVRPHGATAEPASLVARVIGIEVLGHELLLGCRLLTGDHLLHVRAAADWPVRLGDALALQPDHDAWHFFTGEGESLHKPVSLRSPRFARQG